MAYRRFSFVTRRRFCSTLCGAYFLFDFLVGLHATTLIFFFTKDLLIDDRLASFIDRGKMRSSGITTPVFLRGGASTTHPSSKSLIYVVLSPHSSAHYLLFLAQASLLLKETRDDFRNLSFSLRWQEGGWLASQLFLSFGWLATQLSLLSPESGLPIPETANAEAQPSTEIGVGSLALDWADQSLLTFWGEGGRPIALSSALVGERAPLGKKGSRFGGRTLSGIQNRGYCGALEKRGSLP